MFRWARRPLTTAEKLAAVKRKIDAVCQRYIDAKRNAEVIFVAAMMSAEERFAHDIAPLAEERERLRRQLEQEDA